MTAEVYILGIQDSFNDTTFNAIPSNSPSLKFGTIDITLTFLLRNLSQAAVQFID